MAESAPGTAPSTGSWQIPFQGGIGQGRGWGGVVEFQAPELLKEGVLRVTVRPTLHTTTREAQVKSTQTLLTEGPGDNTVYVPRGMPLSPCDITIII